MASIGNTASPIRVAVCGLWHLGSVTAACVADHFATTAYDPEKAVIVGLSSGRPPLFEPGLEEAVHAGLSSGRLAFTSDPVTAVSQAEIVWIAYDTPVDDDDNADGGGHLS